METKLVMKPAEWGGEGCKWICWTCLEIGLLGRKLLSSLGASPIKFCASERRRGWVITREESFAMEKARSNGNTDKGDVDVFKIC